MEQDKIVKMVRPVADLIDHLTVDERIALLEGMLMQEVCNLPLDERDHELRRIQRDLPMILDATERGMREALVQNARAGL